jgi:hypothetical protein
LKDNFPGISIGYLLVPVTQFIYRTHSQEPTCFIYYFSIKAKPASIFATNHVPPMLYSPSRNARNIYIHPQGSHISSWLPNNFLGFTKGLCQCNVNPISLIVP